MNMIYEYIKYIRKAKGRHQIHSPYVYDFVDVCLKKTLSEDLKRKIKFLKQDLNKNHSNIDLKDLGAGSRKKKNINTISSIYNKSSTKGTFFNLLYQISNHYNPNNILELGTNLGIGTIALASGNKNSTTISIEGCKNTLEIAKQNINSLNLKNIELIHSSFDNYIENLNNITFDLVYIDGDHKGESLKRYLNKLNPFTHDETIFILDDIRWSNDMFNTWNELCTSESYHLSLDLFKMGILVKKQSKHKEHFVIKIKNVIKSM